jgi:hypothetical protein
LGLHRIVLGAQRAAEDRDLVAVRRLAAQG